MHDLDQHKKIHFRLVSQEALLFEGDVCQVVAATNTGGIEILPGHTPFCGLLQAGGVKIKTYPDEQKRWFYVSGGILELQANQLTILADSSLHAEDIDLEELARKEALARANLNKPSLEQTEKTIAELAALNAQRKIVKEIGKVRDK